MSAEGPVVASPYLAKVSSFPLRANPFGMRGMRPKLDSETSFVSHGDKIIIYSDLASRLGYDGGLL